MKFNLKTSKHNLTLVDTCSDPQYIKNTIDGMYMGDCAVFIVPAIPKEFDDALVRQENFAMAANIHGVKRIIVCVNKMDASEVAYSQQKY
jgi:elongation factor 1-alpha